MKKEKVIGLQKKSNEIRKETLKIFIEGNAENITSSFSCARAWS